MSITARNICNNMEWMWRKIVRSDPAEATELSTGWLKYALEYLHLRRWPSRIINACLRRGPEASMRRKDIFRMMLFFYGNKMTYVVAGHWVLIRIAISTCSDKEIKATRAICAIVRAFQIAKRNGTILRYFDLDERKYKPIKC